MSGTTPWTPELPAGVRTVTERRPDGVGGAKRLPIPLFVHPEWAERHDWLAQGTTGAGDASQPFDLGLFRDAPVGRVMERWRVLRDSLDMERAVHAHQVHGAEILAHEDGPPGLAVSHGYDGHLTGRSGVLLTVSVADCVPISLVDPSSRRVALLHGGWRGTAAGILGRGLDRLGADPDAVLVHTGPSICGECYEVGPEVHEALGLPTPDSNTPVDLRAVLARQAVEWGVPAERITVSSRCTRCGDGFFSHRGGSGGRQLGVLGLRD